jgi:nucleoside-diphosphate-sugar epimerase
LKRLGADGEGEANLIYVEDLARFAVELSIRLLPEYSVYNANGAEIPTFDEYFDGLSRAIGNGPLPMTRISRLPDDLRRQARRAARLLLRTQRHALRRIAKVNPGLESIVIDIEKTFQHDLRDEPRSRFAKHVVYSNDRAQQVGLKPQTSLQEGVRASAEWAKSNMLMRQ